MTDDKKDEEIARLKEAIRRLADQDATLSVVGGNVIVEMDALTDEEREAISRVYDLLCDRSRELQSATRLDEARPLIQWAKTLQGLWERVSGTTAISGAGKSAPAANTPLTLTDEEREAVETCIADDEAMTHHSRAATLRGLLERFPPLISEKHRKP
jgi:hypothetical protein